MSSNQVNSEQLTLQPPTLAAHLLAVSICALLGWSAWARGGTVVALQGPLPWIGLAILAFLALDRWAPGRQQSASSSSHLTSVLKPQTSVLLFWSGLAFLALLTVQWWNSGRQPYFHPFEQRWVFTPPPHPGWPWAVDRADAAEMLRWFFPAWVLMLALRNARRPAWLAKRVAWFLVINAGLLAAFGIAQALSGTQRIFWVTPMSAHFFASFGYENHAASYFALLFALAAAMLLRGLSAGQRPGVSASLAHCQLPTAPCRPPTVHRRASIATAGTCAVLCLAGMALSLSRAGLALTVGLSGAALLVAARLIWPGVSLGQRLTIAAALVMGVGTFFFVVASMGGNPLANVASGLYSTKLAHDLDIRTFMVRAASQIWQDNPWFGVGGWGYRHFLPVYALEHGGRKLSLGYANTHNDAMQFLCEFGVIGFGLMLTATLAFAWPFLQQLRRQLTPGIALAALGLLAVLLHSLIDLPFRSPAILYAWLAVAGASRWTVGGTPVRLLAVSRSWQTAN